MIVAAIIASAVALGIMAILVIPPPRYTPTAFIRGQGRSAELVSLFAAA